METQREQQPQQPKRRRVVTSCAECHRRKQKVLQSWADLHLNCILIHLQCDRKQPCNVCLAREVPDKCYYGDIAYVVLFL